MYEFVSDDFLCRWPKSAYFIRGSGNNQEPSQEKSGNIRCIIRIVAMRNTPWQAFALVVAVVVIVIAIMAYVVVLKHTNI